MMIDNQKVGKQIALFRKEKGLTGDKLAELLSVSPQAISKWENGKCLPETSILPLLSKALDCSIDTLLVPKELQILSAIYSDGVVPIDVTQTLNSNIIDNMLHIVINNSLLGHAIDSDRIKLLTVKFQTPQHVYYTYANQNETLILKLDSEGFVPESSFKIIDAFYGNKNYFHNAMAKLKHYDYYKWTEIHATHELFPSSTSTDETEYLTIVYTNAQGIYSISCAENEKMCYTADGKHMYVKTITDSHCILPNIMKLQWNSHMDCTWAGALYAALNYMGEDITYEHLMGISGACYRIAFNDIWDWSSVDALIAYHYDRIAYKALGYELIWADRIDKSIRKEERDRMIKDLTLGKPLIAINLRIAPEWGVITGYLENGKRLLCRTYFDNDIFDAHADQSDFAKETGGYLETDFWPFRIAHFGEKLEKPSDKESLILSLKTKVDSMSAPQSRGYYQGFEAYTHWISSLGENTTWTDSNHKEGIFRRLAVNDYQLINLIDARRSAAIYLKNSLHLLEGENKDKLWNISDLYFDIACQLIDFRQKVQSGNNQPIEYNSIKAKGVSSQNLRKEQADLLGSILDIEYRIDELTKQILNMK